MLGRNAPLGGSRSPRFIGEMLRVGESRSSLDPRDSDTTRCRGFSALTPRAHNEEDGRETILFLNAYFLYFAIASYDRFTCAFVFV